MFLEALVSSIVAGAVQDRLRKKQTPPQSDGLERVFRQVDFRILSDPLGVSLQFWESESEAPTMELTLSRDDLQAMADEIQSYLDGCEESSV